MSTQVEINGVTFLPIKDAAKNFSYSRDYVARLAREQKVVATQIKRQWFIDAVSLKNFVEASALEQSLRKQQLSIERKREQSIKQQVAAVRREVRGRVHGVRRQAQLAAFLVLGFGLLGGAGLYTTSALLPVGSTGIANLSLVTPAAEEVVMSEEVALTVADAQPTTLYATEVEHPLFINEEETRALTGADMEGIFLMARDGEVKTVAEVEALFSDDVQVEFIDESTGVVRYTTSTGQVSEYRFVSLPARSVVSARPAEVI
jgi:hypothetical protein